MTTPKDIMKQFPADSVLRKWEAEMVAKNVVNILARTGNTWREMTAREYESERRKDGNWSQCELGYLEQVRGYCISAENAATFSPFWTVTK